MKEEHYDRRMNKGIFRDYQENKCDLVLRSRVRELESISVGACGLIM